ncbi:MAG: glycosyltransferase family 39 protein [Flavobacteriales bacterium]|nr:glycosyltransferase family 39 protein [Flavobacteriales bacterium]
MKKLSINKIFWLFVLSLFSILILSGLVQKGMFLDGITYAAISNNLANGLGGFFHPHYTKTWYNEFYMQPPLVFGVQSLFFKLFGSGFLAERLYSLSMALLSIYGIILNWKLFTKTFNFKSLSWLPILFWVTTPIIFWSYQNNMIENTLSVFALFSVYFISKGIQSNKIYLLIIGSLFILLCFLTKGLVGLFPLAIVVVHFIAFRQLSLLKTIAYSLLILIIPAVLFYFLILIEDGFRQNMMLYIEHQLIPSLNNEREVTTDNRFGILAQLLMEIAAPIIIMGIFLFIYRKKKESLKSKHKQIAIFFFLIGLSASIPLTITHQQRAYYLVMSLSFYILGLSILIAPFANASISQLTKKTIAVLRVFMSTLFIASLIFCIIKFGDYKRDEDRITDIEKIAEIVDKGSTISCSSSLYENWGLIAYLSRMANISIDTEAHKYYIINKHEELINSPAPFKNSYKELDLSLNSYKIYQKIK